MVYLDILIQSFDSLSLFATGRCCGGLSESSAGSPSKDVLQHQWKGLPRHSCSLRQLLGGHRQGTHPLGVWYFGKKIVSHRVNLKVYFVDSSCPLTTSTDWRSTEVPSLKPPIYFEKEAKNKLKTF